MHYEKIIIELANVKIMDPMAALTDLLVSGVNLYAFIKILKINKKGIMYSYFKWHFFSMALATLFAALFGHAFLYVYGFSSRIPGWLISMISISLLEQAYITHSAQLIEQKNIQWFYLANYISLVLFVSFTLFTFDFKFVQFQIEFGILAVILPLQIFMYYKTKDAGSKTTFIMIAMAAFSVLLFKNEIMFNKWFNHVAFSHIIIALSVIYLYKASIKLEFTPETL